MKRRASHSRERKRGREREESGREIVKRPEAKRNEQSSSAATPTFFFPAVRPIFPRVNRPMARSVFRKRSSVTRYYFFFTEMRYTIFVKYILNNEQFYLFFFFLIECN